MPNIVKGGFGAVDSANASVNSVVTEDMFYRPVTNEEEFHLSNNGTNSRQFEQPYENEPDSTSARFVPLLARTMPAEKTAECVKALAEKLRSCPEGHAIKVADVCEEFHCVRPLAHAIIRNAINQVRRFFEIVEKHPTAYFQVPTLSRQSVVIGRTHFDRENEGRAEMKKFIQGDNFHVEFPADDPDKVILTRIHRASLSTDTVED